MIPDVKNKWRHCHCMTCNIPYAGSGGAWHGENLMGNLMYQCGPCLLKDQQANAAVKGNEKTIAGILIGKI